jgi:hypothetical protein
MALIIGVGRPVTDLKSISGVALTGRNWSEDFRALTNDTVKGLMRSLGDTGANPSNATGATLLYRATQVDFAFRYPGSASTFTTTPLGANATYTSSSKDYYNSRLSRFGCIAFADVPSATDGFKIQLSIDNTNWDYVGAKTTVSANVGAALSQEMVARYGRVVYVNGGTAQGTFRLGGRFYI